MRRILLSAAMLAAALPAAAQSVDRTVATSPTGAVEISNVTGSVRVSAWDRNEVRVTGTLGEGTERLDVTSSGDRVVVRVVIPQGARNVRETHLEVRVPGRKNVTARTVSAELEVAGMTGTVDAEATSGDVRVTGNPARVRAVSTSGDVDIEATTARVIASSTSGDVRVLGRVAESISVETVSGDLEINAPAPEMMAKSVSGEVSIRSPTRRLAASTVSGDIQVSGASLQYGALESVSGTLEFSGALEADAALNFQSHSGDVNITLPGNAGARFQVTSFSGDVSSAFGGQQQRTGPGRGVEMNFSSGNGNALVTVKTFSGSVEIGRR